MPKIATIAESWDRIHEILAGHDTDHLKSLAKPASQESIAKAESALGVAFPRDFKDSLKVHEGQKPAAEVGDFPGFYANDECGSYFLMSLKAITREWKMLNRLT